MDNYIGLDINNKEAEAVQPKNLVSLVITALTRTCHMRPIVLSWQVECHKKPADKPL